MPDTWASGDDYEPFIGRWSRQVAVEFLRWLAVGPDRRWVDVGCGTGALTSAVLAHCAPASVVGVDPARGFVEWATEHVRDPRAEFRVGGLGDLPAGCTDVVVSGLVLNFLPDAAAAVSDMAALTTGGVVAAYVWDYADGMQLLRRFWDAAISVDPDAVALDEGRRFPGCTATGLETLWRDAGLSEVSTRAVEVPMVFRDLDDLWQPFLGGQGPAPSYLAALEPDGRNRLYDALRGGLPVAPDGTIRLTARAWAVRGSAQ